MNRLKCNRATEISSRDEVGRGNHKTAIVNINNISHKVYFTKLKSTKQIPRTQNKIRERALCYQTPCSQIGLVEDVELVKQFGLWILKLKQTCWIGSTHGQNRPVIEYQDNSLLFWSNVTWSREIKNLNERLLCGSLRDVVSFSKLWMLWWIMTNAFFK